MLSRTKTKSVPQKNSLGSPKEKESLSPPCLSRPHRAQCSHRNLWSILCIFCHIDRQSVTDSLFSGTMHHVWCITETYNKCFIYAKIFKNKYWINLWIFKGWYCGFTCAELSHRYSISFWAKCNIFFFSFVDTQDDYPLLLVHISFTAIPLSFIDNSIKEEVISVWSYVFFPQGYKFFKGGKPYIFLLHAIHNALENMYIHKCYQPYLLIAPEFWKSNCLVIFSDYKIAYFHKNYLIFEDHGASKNSSVSCFLFFFSLFFNNNSSKIPSQK